MGTDKALIPDSAGQPLALCVASEIKKLCHSVSLVGDPAKYASLGLPVIPDRFPDCGPLAGIEAALGSTDAPLNLIVACDMPLLDTALLDTLFNAGGDCAMPRHHDGELEPLCAVYHHRCHPAILAALEAGTRKVTDALRTLELRYVHVANRAPFANLNTPDDLRKYRNG